MNDGLLITRSLEVLEKTPECYRLYNVVSRFGGVSVGHSSTSVCFQVFREKSYQRFGQIPGMLEAVRRVIENNSPGEGALSKLLASHDEDPSSEFSVRRLLIAALFAAGNEKTSDQTTAKANPAVADTGEPSWAALGLMVRETSFVQVWSRIFFEWAMLGVSPDESLQELRPLYVDHRFGEYLDMYSWDETAKSNAVKKVQSVNTNDAMLQHYLFTRERGT